MAIHFQCNESISLTRWVFFTKRTPTPIYHRAMCSNYKAVTRSDRLLKFFGVVRERDEPSVDTWPLGLAPFIRLAEDGSGNRVVEDGMFGLLPPLASDRNPHPRLSDRAGQFRAVQLSRKSLAKKIGKDFREGILTDRRAGFPHARRFPPHTYCLIPTAFWSDSFRMPKPRDV